MCGKQKNFFFFVLLRRIRKYMLHQGKLLKLLCLLFFSSYLTIYFYHFLNLLTKYNCLVYLVLNVKRKKKKGK